MVKLKISLHFELQQSNNIKKKNNADKDAIETNAFG